MPNNPDRRATARVTREPADGNSMKLKIVPVKAVPHVKKKKK